MTRSHLRTAVFAALLLPASVAAQSAPADRNGWELLLSSGALVPTGAHRDAIRTANLSTAQLSYAIRSRVALTTMFGWARSRDLSSVGDPKLDVFTFDAGLEARATRLALPKSMSLLPFAGVGAGSRSYNHRGLDVDATHNVAGYGAVGGELAKGRVRVRAEVRDYLAGFKPLTGGGNATTRNDIVALVGLRITRKGS